jgi:hypothetical protein
MQARMNNFFIVIVSVRARGRAESIDRIDLLDNRKAAQGTGALRRTQKITDGEELRHARRR